MVYAVIPMSCVGWQIIRSLQWVVVEGWMFEDKVGNASDVLW